MATNLLGFSRCNTLWSVHSRKTIRKKKKKHSSSWLLMYTISLLAGVFLLNTTTRLKRLKRIFVTHKVNPMNDVKEIALKCDCGTLFRRPRVYLDYNKKHPNVFWTWKLRYCNLCYKGRVASAIKHLSSAIKALELKDENNES